MPLKSCTRTAVLVAFAALFSSGCGGSLFVDSGVEALPNRDVTALTADDIVCVMTRAGFTDEQILDLGTDVRNALATTGCARIRVGRKVEALFAVVGDCLHVTSRRRGHFIFDLKTRKCR